MIREVTLPELITELDRASDAEMFDSKMASVTKLLSASFSTCKSAAIIDFELGVRLGSDFAEEINVSLLLLKNFRADLRKKGNLNSPEFRRNMRYGRLLLQLEDLKVSLHQLTLTKQ